jgi:hypothetical protein
MSILSQENLLSEAELRATFRLQAVGTKLNTQENRAFEELAKKRGQTRGDLLRQLILRELRQDAGESTVSAELTETIGLRLMLTNLLKPIATGQKITPEIFDAIMAEVRKTKREVAVEVQRQAEGL